MTGIGFMFLTVVICLAALAFNGFFVWMQYLLYGKWFRLTLPWEWWRDLMKLRQQSMNADSEIIRRESRMTFWGLTISLGVFVAGVVLDTLL